MVGCHIKRYREKKNVTQLELAQWLGVSRQAISMWESGKRDLKVTTLRKIAKVFNISVDEMLEMPFGCDKKEDEMPTPAKTKQQKNKVQFALKAPDAKRVALTGDFKNWSEQGIPLKKSKDGIWKVDVELKPGRYEYKFIVDEQWWLDPVNNKTTLNSFGTLNSVREVGA